MARSVFLGALADPFRRWRVSVVLLLLVGLPAFLLTAALEVASGWMISSTFFVNDAPTGGFDPVLIQQILWLLGHPETLFVLFTVWLLLLGAWGMGIWGASAQGRARLRIGWGSYGRYFLTLLLVGLVAATDVVIVVALGVIDYVLDTFIVLLSNVVAYFVLFRLAPAGHAIRKGRALKLRAAWAASAPDARQALILAMAWVIAGLVIAVMGQLLALGADGLVRAGLAGRVEMPIVAYYVLGQGVPSLINGLAIGYSLLVSVALFWRLADGYP